MKYSKGYSEPALFLMELLKLEREGNSDLMISKFSMALSRFRIKITTNCCSTNFDQLDACQNTEHKTKLTHETNAIQN